MSSRADSKALQVPPETASTDGHSTCDLQRSDSAGMAAFTLGVFAIVKTD